MSVNLGERGSLGSRLRLAWDVLRGRQRWASGYPTPWAYERVCAALREERQRDQAYKPLPTDEGTTFP